MQKLPQKLPQKLQYQTIVSQYLEENTILSCIANLIIPYIDFEGILISSNIIWKAQNIITLSDGRIAYSLFGYHKSIKIWNPETKLISKHSTQASKHKSQKIKKMKSTKNNMIVIVFTNNEIGLFDPKTNTFIDEQEFSSKIKTIQLLTDNDNIILILLYDNSIQVWNFILKTCEKIIINFDIYINHNPVLLLDKGLIAYIPVYHNDIVISHYPKKQQGKPLSISNPKKQRINILHQLSNGYLVSACHGNSITIWDIINGCCVCHLMGHTDIIYMFTSLPDGRLVSCSLDKTIKIWNIETSSCDITLTHESSVTSITCLLDGSLLACYNDGSSQIFI